MLTGVQTSQALVHRSGCKVGVGAALLSFILPGPVG